MPSGVYKRKNKCSELPTKRVWYAMRGRCYDKNRTNYKYYGGRGILICERWEKFANFLADMGAKPVGKTLDRTDNAKGYFKENCRWSDASTQMKNTRRAKYFEGIHFRDAAIKYGINYRTVLSRINYGWNIQDCFKK